MATRDAYTMQEWENLPAETTPVTAERLAHIEQGIKDASDKRALKEIYGDNGLNTGNSNTIDVDRYIINGDENIAQNGYDISINGDSNHVIGDKICINGMGNTVNGTGNSVDGSNNTLSGSSSYVSKIEGYNNTAVNPMYSHIGGSHNKMLDTGNHNAVFMHGMGNECRASDAGAVFGFGNILHGHAQFVIGRYSEDCGSAFVVGGGDGDNNRKNIHTIDWYGNAVFTGNVQGTWNGKTMSLYGIQMEMESRYNSLNSGLSSLGIRLDGIEQMTYEETISALNSETVGENTKIPNVYAIRDWCKTIINP